MAAPTIEELKNCEPYMVSGSDKILIAYWNPATKLLHHYGKGKNFISTVGCKNDPANESILGLVYFQIVKDISSLSR